MDSYEEALVRFVEAFDKWRITDEGLLWETWCEDNREYMVLIKARERIDYVT